MNNKKIFLIITAWILCGFVTNANAQYPQFIGPSDPSAVAVTPKHHITVYTGGFDQVHKKWDQYKTFNKCASLNFPIEQCTAAQDYARAINGFQQPSILLNEVDSAVDHVTGVWRNCGGQWAAFANSFDWSRITVVVHDTAFPNPSTGIISGGITTDSGHRTEVVNLFFQGWFCCQPNVTLATMGEFCRYEFGNAVAWQFHGQPSDAGDAPPCQH